MIHVAGVTRNGHMSRDGMHFEAKWVSRKTISKNLQMCGPPLRNQRPVVTRDFQRTNNSLQTVTAEHIFADSSNGIVSKIAMLA